MEAFEGQSGSELLPIVAPGSNSKRHSCKTCQGKKTEMGVKGKKGTYAVLKNQTGIQTGGLTRMTDGPILPSLTLLEHMFWQCNVC